MPLKPGQWIYCQTHSGSEYYGVFLEEKKEKIGRRKKWKFLDIGGTFFRDAFCESSKIRRNYINRIFPLSKMYEKGEIDPESLNKILLGIGKGELLRKVKNTFKNDADLYTTALSALGELESYLDKYFNRKELIDQIEKILTNEKYFHLSEEGKNNLKPKETDQDWHNYLSKGNIRIDLLKQEKVTPTAESVLLEYRNWLLREKLRTTWYFVGTNAHLNDSTYNLLIHGNIYFKPPFGAFITKATQFVIPSNVEFVMVFTYGGADLTEDEVKKMAFDFDKYMERVSPDFKATDIPMITEMMQKNTRLVILIDQESSKLKEIVKKHKILINIELVDLETFYS